ncbi:MAG: response regulator [Paracoccaceae bacterium]
MRILLVQHNKGLSEMWSLFLRKQGLEVVQAFTQSEAVEQLMFDSFDALILDIVLPDGGAIAISDYATYRQPDVPIIAVTSSSFFSDGSIFELMPNAKSLMRTPLRPDDLVAVLEHYVPQDKKTRKQPEVA